MRRALRWIAPMLLFAGLLALAEWLARSTVSWLPLKTLAVFLISTAAVRLAPWSRLLCARPPGSPLYGVTLFVLFVAHFTGILATESRRLMVARSFAAPSKYRGWWFGSLRHALVELFVRSFIRAERFYAAQWLRGEGE